MAWAWASSELSEALLGSFAACSRPRATTTLLCGPRAVTGQRSAMSSRRRNRPSLMERLHRTSRFREDNYIVATFGQTRVATTRLCHVGRTRGQVDAIRTLPPDPSRPVDPAEAAKGPALDPPGGRRRRKALRSNSAQQPAFACPVRSLASLTDRPSSPGITATSRSLQRLRPSRSLAHDVHRNFRAPLQSTAGVPQRILHNPARQGSPVLDPLFAALARVKTVFATSWPPAPRKVRDTRVVAVPERRTFGREKVSSLHLASRRRTQAGQSARTVGLSATIR